MRAVEPRKDPTRASSSPIWIRAIPASSMRTSIAGARGDLDQAQPQRVELRASSPPPKACWKFIGRGLGLTSSGLRWGAPPRRSGHEARDARQHKPKDVLDRTSGRQMHLDHGFHFDSRILCAKIRRKLRGFAGTAVSRIFPAICARLCHNEVVVDLSQDSGIAWDCFIPSVKSYCAASAIPGGWDKLTQGNGFRPARISRPSVHRNGDEPDHFSIKSSLGLALSRNPGHFGIFKTRMNYFAQKWRLIRLPLRHSRSLNTKVGRTR